MINTWNESLLHEELKTFFRGENGQTEVPIEGSICDIVNEDGSIIEIQTSNLGILKQKLSKLLLSRKVTLVYPIAKNILVETWGVDNSLISRRKSPKHGTIFQLFKELTGIVGLLNHTNLILMVLFVDIMEIRIKDGKGSWRSKGVSKKDKKLLKMHESLEFKTLMDYGRLIPASVPELFTVKDLQKAGAGIHAGRMAWVLRNCGCIKVYGKKGNAFIYYRHTAFGNGKEINKRVPFPSSEKTSRVP